MSRFEIEDTFIEGVKVFTRQPIGDERGWFERFFCIDTMQSAGWPDRVVHVNHTFTATKGTVRGMHFQYPPHAEYKYVSCLTGRIFDVALDLRKNSPTYLQYFGIELTADNHKSLIVPAGVAHGFQSLEEDTKILYLVSTAYNVEHEDGINPRDPSAAIEWPLDISTMSAKDSGKPDIDQSFEGISL